MDPRNPYSQNYGYMGLLNNVHNNNVQENFPYESYPSTVDIGASEILPFSSQQSEVSSDSSMHPEGIKAAKASRNIRKGKVIEDYKTIMEGKMEELATKEKLSKLTILDTLLAKKDPLSTQYALLSDKVNYIAAVSDYESELNQVKDLHHETELKLVVLEKTLAELSKKISPFGNRFEVVLGGLVLVVMVMAVFVMFK
ncbi:hypothetical protein Bca52824_054959 [Brassica carinata]|uniref:Uncharacterized protein n=1 Tax=Brassica carinata TaxID=52824 RepID=A0A8X7UMC3_BRACI|nr:hypothetical protein Bca52824_054959 [Brassica carinata]